MLLLTQAPPLRKAENVGCVFSEREAKQVHTDPHPTKSERDSAENLIDGADREQSPPSRLGIVSES